MFFGGTEGSTRETVGSGPGAATVPLGSPGPSATKAADAIAWASEQLAADAALQERETGRLGGISGCGRAGRSTQAGSRAALCSRGDLPWAYSAPWVLRRPRQALPPATPGGGGSEHHAKASWDLTPRPPQPGSSWWAGGEGASGAGAAALFSAHPACMVQPLSFPCNRHSPACDLACDLSM